MEIHGAEGHIVGTSFWGVDEEKFVTRIKRSGQRVRRRHHEVQQEIVTPKPSTTDDFKTKSTRHERPVRDVVERLPKKSGPIGARFEIALAPALMAISRIGSDHPKSLTSIAGPLTHNGVSFRDVNQDEFSDCHFLSGLVSWAECDPTIVSRLIKQRDENHSTVTLHNKKMEPVELDIDHRKLVRGVRAHGEDEGAIELWPLIIENAFMQLKGNPERIDYGWADKSLECLTGRPYSRVFLHNPDKHPAQIDEIWRILLARSHATEKKPDAWECKLTSPAAATSQYLRKSRFTRFIRLRGTNKKIAPRHAYAIVGLGENAELGRYVVLHDQRGRVRHLENNGTVRLSMAEFLQQYRWLHVSREPW
ncbi:MAG: hypothetical protein A2289_12765 [Deltaproteobacteria bacterium RIFOXYA12_FULL_58_15]|nr:MAG: hypothetical protein A2289_12765 [Deltaproteobacteria bacterium RIFOXYA12_FULL_58_15]